MEQIGEVNISGLFRFSRNNERSHRSNKRCHNFSAFLIKITLQDRFDTIDMEICKERATETIIVRLHKTAGY